MNPTAAPDYFELSDYADVIRRRWRTVAAFAVLGIALAAAYAQTAPQTYTSTVLIQVNALPNNANAVGGRTGGPVNMDNEGQIARSGTVAAIVKSTMNSTLSTNDISQNIRVSVPPNSTFLQITYAGPTARGAQQWANAVGQAYLDERRSSIETVVGTGIKALRAEATRLREEIERLKVLVYSTRHATHRPSVSPVQVNDSLQLANAQTALASVQTHVDAALPLYDSLAAPHNVIVGSIVTPATLPTQASSPRKLLILPSGLLAGLVLGLALAFVRDFRDKRIHSARDAARIGGSPALLSLTGKASPPVTAVESPRSRAGQAFSELARYVSAALGGASHVLVVAATSPGSSGSVVAANLAVALARTGEETAVICGDLYETRIPELLGIGHEHGLSEVLAGSATGSEVACRPAGLPRLRIVTPGLEPSGVVSAVRYAKFRQLITDLLHEVRYVIIEVQSAGENAGTFSLAEFAETAIVVAEAGRSRPADFADCLNRLERLRTPVLGTAILSAGASSRRRSAEAPAEDPAEPSAGEPAAGQPSGGKQVMAEPAQWTVAASRGSRERPDPVSAPGPRQVSETWPMPKVVATERDGFTDRTDPVTGR